VQEQSDENLRVYATSATRVDEDAGQEMNLAHGGYGKRQLLELVQNGADAILASPGGRIQVVLTADYLYCANEGDAINSEGIKALLHAHISRKRESEIGRFGLGFKSVLGVTDRPEFYCREVSFGFDGAWAREQISLVAPNRERYPSLRLAKLLDPDMAAESDSILGELMEWATSVVRLPRSLGQSEWLSEDFKNFDSAFMLFSPHVGELVLSDRTTGLRREIRLKAEGNDVTVSEGADARRWRVFRSSIRPSQEAKREAWELSARDELPIVWAVPLEGRLTVGRFWAFFPLRDDTTLTGIANAPWQINDDRTGLLEASRLNKELLEELCELALKSLPALRKEDDPGWILDVIPARRDEARCWGDRYLTDRFYERGVDRPIIPDQSGTLLPAAVLKLPPVEASREALELWAAAPRRPNNWCHATSISTPTRRSRVERLFEGVGKRGESVPTWLDVLLSEKDLQVDDASQAVLTAAALIGDETADKVWNGRRFWVHQSHILLDASRRLAQANPAEIFIPANVGSPSTVRVVHPDLVERPGVRAALTTIGLDEVTPALELKVFIQHGLRDRSREQWDTLWTLVRQVEDVDEAISVLGAGFSARALAVRTISGEYRPLQQTLLPGSVVPADGSRDAEVAIDADFHESELGVLRRLGAEQAPTAGHKSSGRDLIRSYLDRCILEFIAALPADSSKPDWERLRFDRETHIGPLEPLRHLSDEGRAAFTEELIKAAEWGPWTLRHETQQKYPARAFPSAYVWVIQQEGRLRTSRGLVVPAKAWGRNFERWADIAPVASLSDDETARLGVPRSSDELTASHWADAFQSASESTNDGVLGSFYALAARAGVTAPVALRCRIGSSHGERPRTDVVVTHDRGAFAALRDLEQPSLLVSTAEETRVLVENWSLVPSSAHVRQDLHWVEAGSSASLADAFPTLREELEAADLADAQFVPCVEIFETIATDAGTRTLHREFQKVQNGFLWKESLGLETALRHVAPHLGFEVTDEEITSLAEGRWKQDRRDKLASIRDQATNAERLLQALGEEIIRSRLPIGLVDAVSEIHGRPLTPADIADLIFVVHGEETLHHLRDDLRAAGLQPPDTWAGRREARSFVRDLGFPDAFAGSPAVHREPELVVLGPTDLPELHDYQTEIVEEIHKMIYGDEAHPRGMISLPTGAGKTRVAVQALVQALSCGRLSSPVLWIAQSDELCEQAVQTWSEVWRAIGSVNELRIGRLWGPAREVSEAAPNTAQVVVATIDKLRNRVESADYSWLAEASCVVVDEAHSAITQEYTRVLRWLGISAAGRAMTTRAPLLGLTATPFRGTSIDETERLVRGFGGRRLDRIDDDDYGRMYRKLQLMGVLSNVDGEELETGIIIDMEKDLSAAEKSSFAQMRDLPSRVFDKIAKDVDRNRLLLKSILSRPTHWPILLFAVSIEHAHTMAALLAMEGVPAAAIDYRTEAAVRRRNIERFRSGELRVLTNFNVLTQGFDAPAVRAIYVARPTFSPNNYQQMVGRGLRGELNGGTDRCLIVNVRDNWTVYGDRLAFLEFEHLWKPDGAL